MSQPSAIHKIKQGLLDGDLIAGMRGDLPGQDVGERFSFHDALLIQIARNTRPVGSKPVPLPPPEPVKLPTASAPKKGTVGKSA